VFSSRDWSERRTIYVIYRLSVSLELKFWLVQRAREV